MPQELAKALAKCKGSQLVLLDTAGRSPKNQEQLEELQLLLSQVPQAEKHLVLFDYLQPRRAGNRQTFFRLFAG